MDNKKAIEELKQIKQNHIDLNYRFRHLYDDYIIAVDIAIASLKAWDKVKEQILEEKEYAYADFDVYKKLYLDVEPDELPDDDFRFGMERTIEIINKHLKEIEE